MPTVGPFPVLRCEIAGIPLTQLARQFGTPLFVYDAAKIAERIADLCAFDVVRFAQKANSNLAVLAWVRRQGALVDTVSAGEIHRALAAGYTTGGHPPQIVYTADIFDRESLAMVVRHGIHVNCGSPDMIEQLGRCGAGTRDYAAHQPGIRTWTQPEDEHGWRTVQTRHLA